MQNYAGSIAIGGSARHVAITSPRGGRVQVYDLNGRLTHTVNRADVCGIGPGASGFVATDGLGGILAIEGEAATPLNHCARAWDNHLIAI